MDDPPTPPTAAAAEEPLQPTQPHISTGKGVKETIESILIAFILAFVFRAFVVEAFVIPTGSMATTLLGAHMRFTCRECGYQFDVNYPSPGGGADEVDIASTANQVFRALCPNCRQRVDTGEEKAPYVRYGDRILVLKYLYIPWVSAPHRWDVVVFKTPTPVEGAPLYTVNYIKRLIGVPGDWIMLLDGDVYVCHDPRYANLNPEDALHDIPPSAWQIQPKPKYAQDALWRIIYDNDYRPLENNRSDDWRLPWVHDPDDGWDTGDREHARTFTFNNTAGGGRLRFDPTTVPNYHPQDAPGGYFTDWLAYDETMQQNGSNPETTGGYATYTVSDFKLAFTYDRHTGDGPLTATLTKHYHDFSLELRPDGVRLTHTLPNGDRADIPALRAFNPAAVRGPVRVSFENVDYQVTVRLNDQVVFQTTREQFHPNVEDLLNRYQRRGEPYFPNPSVSIEARRQTASLSHISLWRDVYYTPEDTRSRMEITHARPSNPVKLGDDEYFVMGDNSAASSDARFWTQPVDVPEENLHVESGRVPGRFMLGRAFFVYWPAGYRPLKGAPALVPNFGDMRLIQ
jgi:signal peptidase I